MKSLHLLISGRVQGVGFRDWLIHEAMKRGLTGWVRNVNHDKVEAVICGQDDVVDDCVQRCWQGPGSAKVNDISITDTPPPDEAGFTRRSSVS
jgi:acylphosphatase